MLPPALGGLRFRVPPIPKPLGFREYVNDQAPHMAHATAERRELYQNRRAQIKRDGFVLRDIAADARPPTAEIHPSSLNGFIAFIPQ